MKTQNKLPEGWQEVELGEVLDYEQPSKYIVLSEDYNDNYKTPVLTAGKSFVLGRTNETDGIYENLPVIIFDDFTTASHFVNFKFKVKSSAMKMLRPKIKDVDLKFIFLLMQTIRFGSATHKRYYLSTYSKLKILLPPLPIQKKIVSILEKAESLKQKREEADKLTNEYLKSVFYEMFLKKKFARKSLKEVCEEVQNGFAFGQFNENGGLVHIRPFNISEEGNLVFEQIKYIPKEEVSSKKYLLEINDVIINTTNSAELVGKTAIFNSNKECSFSNHMTKLRVKKEVISPNYLWFVLNYYWRTGNFRAMTKSWVNQVGIDSALLKSLQIPLPPLPLQQKFAKIVEKVEKLKEKQKESKEKISELFDALMQKAFNGELV